MTTPTNDSLFGEDAMHSVWMRRLALSLVRDPSIAEDVVQDTWTKLSGKDAQAPGYLAAIVRSLSGRHHRAEKRRRRREHEVARSEELPSAAEIAQRTEIVRLVAQALDELRDPYRATIVLHYFDGLSSAEIGRRGDIPSSTVRARLKRGLDLLRVKLDEGRGGREGWISALLPLAHRPLSSSALITTLSTLAIMKVFLGLLLGVCGIAVAWAYYQPHEETDDVTVSNVVEPLPTLEVAEPGLARIGADADLRESLGMPSSRSDPAARSSLSRVRARVVDATQNPIEGAWLRLWQTPTSVMKTSSDGRVELLVPRLELEWLASLDSSRAIALQIGGPGFRTDQLERVLSEGSTTLELGDVALSPGGVVSGRVLDEFGVGVEGVQVLFGKPVEESPGDMGLARSGPPDLYRNLMSTASTPPLFAASVAGGSFRLEGVPVGHGSVWARSSLSLWSFTAPIGVRAGEEVGGVELTLHDGSDEIITGLIFDPDGRPLPALQLTFKEEQTQGASRYVHTDAAGRFFFAPQNGVTQDISVASPNWEWEHKRIASVPIGTRDLAIAFERSEWLEFNVRSPDGTAIGNGELIGLDGTEPPHLALSRVVSPLDEFGNGRLRRTDGPLLVRVQAPGYHERLLGPFDPAHFDSPLVVTLETAPALVGQVLRADGRPAAGARVALHRGASKDSGTPALGSKPSSPRYYLTHQGWSGDRDPFVYDLFVEPDVQVTADAEGRFRLPLPGTGEQLPREHGLLSIGYVGSHDHTSAPDNSTPQTWSVSNSPANQAWFVSALGEDMTTLTSGPHKFDPTEDAELNLQLPPGGSIAGRLVLSNGASAAGWTARASDGMAQISEVEVAEDGSFVFDHLHAGGWQVRVFEPGTKSDHLGGSMRTDRIPEPDVVVLAGKTVEYEHLAGPLENAHLRGQLFINGAAPGSWEAMLTTGTESGAFRRHRVSLDPDGKFEFDAIAGLNTTLELFRPSRTGQFSRFSVSKKLKLLPGENTCSLDLHTARIEGQLPASLLPTRGTNRVVYTTEEGDTTVRVRLVVDEQGHFGPTVVPAGRGVLYGPSASFRQKPPVWSEVDLDPGELRVVNVRE